MYNIARSRSQNFLKISLLFFRQMEAKWNNNSGFAIFFLRFDAKVELQNWALVLMWNKEFTIIFFLLLPSKLLNCIYIISVRYMINSRTSKWWLKQIFFEFQSIHQHVILTGSPENSGGSSFWNYGRTAMDYTHVLKKYVYQLASRSPHSLTTTNNDNDQSNSYNGEDVSFSQIIV